MCALRVCVCIRTLGVCVSYTEEKDEKNKRKGQNKLTVEFIFNKLN